MSEITLTTAEKQTLALREANVKFMSGLKSKDRSSVLYANTKKSGKKWTKEKKAAYKAKQKAEYEALKLASRLQEKTGSRTDRS